MTTGVETNEKVPETEDRLPELSDEQVRKDNPHFGPTIRTVTSIKPYHSRLYSFTYIQTVGAYDSEGYYQQKIDAWATYLWSPAKNEWCLGAN